MHSQTKSTPRRRRWVAAALVGAALALGAVPRAGAGDSSPSVVVNVNTATLDELQALPGIGEARAQAILAARQARGGFKSVDELLEVRGIGPANLERLRPHVSLRGQTRISSPERAR